MYKAFYKLTRNPFDITPDPYFFLPTPHHNEALATLYYGVRSRKGFVVVTGEVGTGKTLLLQCLLNFLNVNKVAFSYVFNALLTPEEFFCYVLRDLGLPRAQFLTALLAFNGGVEAGQLSVIAACAAGVAYWRSDQPSYRRFIIQPASVAIASVGLYWTIQRALS